MVNNLGFLLKVSS